MSVLFPALLRFSDVGLLLLRLMVAVVFFSSGLNHLKDPVARSHSIGMSPRFSVPGSCSAARGWRSAS